MHVHTDADVDDEDVHIADEAQVKKSRLSSFRLRATTLYGETEAYKVRFTKLMLGLCCTVFVWELWYDDWYISPLAENPLVGPTTLTLLDTGAMTQSAVFDDKEVRVPLTASPPVLPPCAIRETSSSSSPYDSMPLLRYL